MIKMRTVAGVLFIFAATISTASAQGASFSMDHGHAADAAAASRAAAAFASNRASAIAAGGPLTPSQSTDFKINGGTVLRAAPARTPEEEKADEEARAAWQTRCRPSVVEDREGIRRTQYAEPDCDLSRFNTAGK
jgi:gamma-glutamyltranspeptidase